MDTEQWIELRGTVRFNTTDIPSENDLYKPNYQRRHMYKNPTIVQYQSDFVQMAWKTDLIKAREYIDKWAEIRIELHYYLDPKRKFWGLDVTNMTKATEDALKEVTGIDDSKHKSVFAEKYIASGSYSEILIIYRIKLKADG